MGENANEGADTSTTTLNQKEWVVAEPGKSAPPFIKPSKEEQRIQKDTEKKIATMEKGNIARWKKQSTETKEQPDKNLFIRRRDDQQALNIGISSGEQQLVNVSGAAGRIAEHRREGASNVPLKIAEKLPIGATISIALEVGNPEKHFLVIEPDKTSAFDPNDYPNTVWVKEVKPPELAQDNPYHYSVKNLPYTKDTKKQFNGAGIIID